MDDFVTCCNAENRLRGEGTETTFRCFAYENPGKRDKANLDHLLAPRRKHRGRSALLPSVGIAVGVLENLRAALEHLGEIVGNLVPGPAQ